jgi:hypothetical protein
VGWLARRRHAGIGAGGHGKRAHRGLDGKASWRFSQPALSCSRCWSTGSLCGR